MFGLDQQSGPKVLFKKVPSHVVLVNDKIGARPRGGYSALKRTGRLSWVSKLQIYLYHFVKKGGQFSTFKAKTRPMLYRFGPRLAYFGQNLGRWTNFDKDFG